MERVDIFVESRESAGTAPAGVGVGVHCACCAMVPLAEALRMTFRRAGVFESGARSVEYKVALRPLLMMAAVCAPAGSPLTAPTRK